MKTILLADDNIYFNSKCRDFLTKDSTIKVIQSFDGKDTLKKYLTLNPDVLILDYKLPKLDGIKVLNEISKYQNNSNSKNIIFITGSSSIKSSLLKHSNIYSYLIKPFDFQALTTSINNIIDLNKFNEQKNKIDIEKYLYKLGVQNVKSTHYKFLVYSINLLINNENMMDNLKNVYFLVAKKYNTTEKRVQDRIYYNIKQIEKNMPKKYLNSIFNVYCKADKFTAKHFFDMTLNYFKSSNYNSNEKK